MLKIYSFILLTFLLSCNNKSDNNFKNPIDSTHVFTDQTKSYDIKGFMSFDDKTTLETVTSLLKNQEIDFILNPDLLTIRTYSGNIFTDDCPYIKFVYAPRLKLEEFSFKNLIFSFYQDSLICLAISEENQFDNGEIFKLKSYYEMKYGETENVLSTKGYFQWNYLNKKENVLVRFNREIRKTYHSDLTEDNPILIDKFTISFKSFNKVLNKCLEYSTQERNKKEQKKQKILDKL